MASSGRVRAILQLVSELSEAEREELRDELDAEVTPEQWNSAWDDELSRRMAQIEGGEVQYATLDEVAERLLNRD
jgi:putative addiction module component (TIGR02574 family)